MSRIGNTIIIVPKEATVGVEGAFVDVKGPKGELRMNVPARIRVQIADGKIEVKRTGDDKPTRALHGYVRANLDNLITGVTKGWTKTLELSGVGYRAAVSGENLTLNLGFSHPVTIEPPKGIQFSVNEGKIVVSGSDKQLVGQVAAKIREIKKPEPYKGKGIKYQGEHIRKKAGKAAKAIGGAPGIK
ncbi:MAG: 50S ribosomal protein L6 [Candidatus Gottesmanbacteria bacterium]|nr:50S ribosomal protein L6 [Candidatus Gottesmanbacteria bacterium]